MNITPVIQAFFRGEKAAMQDNYNRVESNGVSLTVNGVMAINYHSDIFHLADTTDLFNQVFTGYKRFLTEK